MKNDNTNTSKEIVKSMIQSLEDLYKEMYKETIAQLQSNYYASPDAFNTLRSTHMSEVKKLSLSALRSFVDTFSNSDSFLEEYQKIMNHRGNMEHMEVPDQYGFTPDTPDYSSLSFKEYLDMKVEEMWKMVIRVVDIESNIITLKEDIIEETENYLSNKDIRGIRTDLIQKMKEKATTMEEGKEKREILRKITIMENCDTLNFFTERLTDPKTKERDKESIMKAFFKVQEGSYVMDKFDSKIKKFGFPSSIYTHLLGLEETFLDESYYCFNNLFLFAYMRYVSYADPYNETDRMYVQAITEALTSLVYHNGDPSREAYTISLIQRFDNFFTFYRKKFEHDNTTNPLHPERIKNDADRREYIEKYFEEHGVDYDKNLPMKRLALLYKDIVKAEEKKVLEEYHSMNKEETEEENENTENTEVIDTEEISDETINESGNIEENIDSDVSETQE